MKEGVLMTFHGHGVVWDNERNFQLMKFIDGKFETNDQYIAKKLLKLGYPYTGISIIEGYPLTDIEPEEKEVKPKKSRRLKE
jgi:hypothetical protein